MADPTELQPSDAALRDQIAAEAKARQQAEDAEQKRLTTLHRRALRRFKTVVDAEHDLRREMETDLRMVAGGEHQWDDVARRARKGRPMLSINQLRPYTRQVINRIREGLPQIQVNPVDNGADPETAEVIQGLIRHIETQSDALVAYITAVEAQVRMGRGYLRVYPRFVDQGWEQEIRIERIRNPFRVYMDPGCQASDYADARYGFIAEELSKDDYLDEYGTARTTALISLEQSRGRGDWKAQWCPQGSYRIAEYFEVDNQDDEWVEAAVVAPDGQRVTQSGYLSDLPADLPLEIVRRRPASKRVVRWLTIDGAQVLAETTLPGTRIPIIPVLGEELELDGQVDYRGMVRDARDAQKIANYEKSALVEQIALAPRAPWVAAVGQIDDDKIRPLWERSNTELYAVLPYKPVSVEGHLVPPPQRQAVEPPIQATALAVQMAQNDLRATTGYYDVQSQETARSETSGRAILARQKQGETGNLDYADNLSRALRALGRLLLEWIPVYYSAAQVRRIKGLDDQEREVFVGTGVQGQPPPDGLDRVFDLGVGRYDVTISTGPSYQTARQEAADKFLSLIQAVPPVGPAVMDIFVGNLDGPGMRQAANRLKKLLPPQVQEVEPGQVEIPPQVQQQIAQAQAMIEALTKELNAKTDLINSKALELASKEYIAGLQEHVKAATALAKLDADQARTELEAQLTRIETLLQLNQDRILAEQQAATQSAEVS